MRLDLGAHRLVRASAGSSGSSPFAARTSAVIDRPARRPKTRMSMSELVPSRLAPWTRDARALPCRVQARQHRALLVDRRRATSRSVGMPPMRVVRRGLDGHRLGDRLDALVDAGELGDVGQLLVDDLLAQVGQVEVDEVLAADAAARADLQVTIARLTMSRGASSISVGA